jgi:HD-like signal output (HDOD) protein
MVPDPADLKQSDRKGVLASIPAFPPIVLRLLDLLAREDVEIRDLVALISADPAFCAQVLKVANSPVYGCRYQVDSLQSALFVLGLNRVRCLCTTLATANQLKALLHVGELARCWRHMLACALLTSELARCCSAFEDRAYTAGLLHDIGRLGLLLAYPKEYAALLRDGCANAVELLDAEERALGMDHCAAGGLLAAHWGLPSDLRLIAGHHHDPQSSAQLDLLTLVHLGCKLADALGFWVVPPLQPRSPQEIQATLLPALAGRIRIEADDWRETLEQCIRYYADPDGERSDPHALPLRPVPECESLPVAELARLRLPDPNASPSLPYEFGKLVGIGRCSPSSLWRWSISPSGNVVHVCPFVDWTDGLTRGVDLLQSLTQPTPLNSQKVSTGSPRVIKFEAIVNLGQGFWPKRRADGRRATSNSMS